MTRVLVCGGRDFRDGQFLYQMLDALHKSNPIDVLIEGDARGADRLAGYWARKHHITNLKFPADWKRYGKAAGGIRNALMLAEGKPDLVVAFPGGNGTRNMMNKAKDAGIEVIQPEPDG